MMYLCDMAIMEEYSFHKKKIDGFFSKLDCYIKLDFEVRTSLYV